MKFVITLKQHIQPNYLIWRLHQRTTIYQDLPKPWEEQSYNYFLMQLKSNSSLTWLLNQEVVEGHSEDSLKSCLNLYLNWIWYFLPAKKADINFILHTATQPHSHTAVHHLKICGVVFYLFLFFIFFWHDWCSSWQKQTLKIVCLVIWTSNLQFYIFH